MGSNTVALLPDALVVALVLGFRGILSGRLHGEPSFPGEETSMKLPPLPPDDFPGGVC